MDMIKTNEHFREALLETVPCSVFMVDVNNHTIFWNHSVEKLTQYEAKEIVGLTCDKLQIMICIIRDDAIRMTFCPLLSLARQDYEFKPRVTLVKLFGGNIAKVMGGSAASDEKNILASLLKP